jgi:hypothetical protein
METLRTKGVIKGVDAEVKDMGQPNMTLSLHYAE